MQKIKLKIEPREPFRDFLASDKKFLILVAHRRAGKTVAAVQKLFKDALTHKRSGPRLRYAYIAPTRSQAKDIAWSYLVEYADKIPCSEVNVSELRVNLANGAEIRLYSGENYERMRGLYFDGVVSDEDDDIPANAFKYVIMPCLLDYNGWHVRMGTPKGKGNLYKSLIKADADSKTYSTVVKASESGILSKEQLGVIKSQIGDDAYNQEMECDFNVGRPGALYAEALTKLRIAGRVTDISVDNNYPVYTFWDLGSPINTSIWWVQVVGRDILVLDHHSNEDLTIGARVAQINEKDYHYGGHILPHDGGATQKNGLTYASELEKAGLKTIRILPVTRDVNIGINALRAMMPMMWIDKVKCEEGLEALESYHLKFNEKTGVFDDKPNHDWSSHSSDALRYFAEASLCGFLKTPASGGMRKPTVKTNRTKKTKVRLKK